MPISEITRCGWVNLSNPAYVEYHDTEWGVPVYEDHQLFEALTLEGAQAGLSWETVLSKRENYRHHFKQFDIETVARFSEKDLDVIVKDPGIIRHKGKLTSVVTNARAILKLNHDGYSFSDFLWKYVDGIPRNNYPQKLSDIPSFTPLSTQLSDDLKKRGFSFVGKTIMYAFMQATGMINDHLQECWCATPKSET